MHVMLNKPPRWVWIISVFYIISSVWTSTSWYIVVSRGMHNTPETKTYFGSLMALNYGLMIAQALVTLSAAIMLLLLSKAAYRLFCAAFIMALISAAVRPGGLRTMQSVKGGILGYFLGMMILLGICLYTKQLRDQGKLR